MGKSVNLLVRQLFLFLTLLIVAGCITVHMPNYIPPTNHPYVRKISGNYNEIIDAIKVVLFKDGYTITSQLNPSIYERRSDGGDQSKDELFFTNMKQHPRLLYSTYTHLNIFVHPIAEGAEVEVRYNVTTSVWFKPLQASRNDTLANRFLNQIEQELESK